MRNILLFLILSTLCPEVKATEKCKPRSDGMILVDVAQDKSVEYQYLVSVSENGIEKFKWYSVGWEVKPREIDEEKTWYVIWAKNSVKWNEQKQKFIRCGNKSSNYSCGWTWTSPRPGLSVEIINLKNCKIEWSYREDKE